MIPVADIYANYNAKITFSALGVVGQHIYYRNSDINKIYFLNIPKNASEFIRNSMHFIDNPSSQPKSFCIVRDPLERLISIYKYMINVEERFDDFFDAFFKKKNLSNKNYIKVGIEHLMPQKFFIDNAPTEWKKDCQLLTMESFFEDGVTAGFKKIGLNPRIEIPSKKINFSEYDSGYKEWFLQEIYAKYPENLDEYLKQDLELYERAKNNSGLA